MTTTQVVGTQGCGCAHKVWQHLIKRLGNRLLLKLSMLFFSNLYPCSGCSGVAMALTSRKSPFFWPPAITALYSTLGMLSASPSTGPLVMVARTGSILRPGRIPPSPWSASNCSSRSTSTSSSLRVTSPISISLGVCKPSKGLSHHAGCAITVASSS